MVSYIPESNYKVAQYLVLILVVVDNGLVLSTISVKIKSVAMS